MITNKKADLSINMIVIVAICLVVLVIMIFLVASRGKNLDRSTGCASLGGVCAPYCQNDLGRWPGVCTETRQYCCNPLDVR